MKLKVSSLQKGSNVIAYAHSTNITGVQDGLLIGSTNKRFREISESQRQMW